MVSIQQKLIAIDEDNEAITPASIEGLLLWLDSIPSAYTLNTTQVVSLADQSGNGYNASAITTLSQPTYVASGLAGYPAFRTNGGIFDLPVLNSTLLTTLSGLSKTVFIVYTPKVIPSSAQRLIQTRTSAGGTGFNFEITSTTSLYSFNHSRASGGAVASTVTAVVDTSVLLSLTVSGTTATFHINGVQAGQITNATSYTRNADNLLRLGTFDGSQFPSNGEYSEVIAYNSALTTADRQAIEQYIKNKYNFF